ncbi:lamin tail domain-containing protein [Candidatus Sumerlaeota bacterium]|nr:lamin tail domain-containing protein [Candidatus Sumerlaeota bacterium]
MRILMAFVLAATLIASVSADLIISEVHDGPLTGGHPKFIELTNTGPGAIADLSIYSVVIFGNGSTSPTPGSDVALDAVALAEGDSYVMASASQEYFDAYGVLPDQFGVYPYPATAQNGDDTIILHLTANPASDAVDIYGVYGVDGTGLYWEFLDSSAYRVAGVTAASATMVTSEWTVMAENDNDGSGLAQLPLMTNPGVHNGHLLTLSTQMGTGDLATPTPALTTGISGADIVNGVTATIGGLGLHGAASAGSDVALSDGATNAADNLSGLFADSGVANATPTTVSWTFAPPGVFITGINSYCQNTGADSRVFQNCHIYLDLTNDATDNPTFYAEAAVGTNNQNNVTDANTWSAFYLGVPSSVMGGGPVYGIRLDYYSPGAVGGAFIGEYDGEAGSIIKEIDILGVVVPVELSVFSTN